MTTSSKAAPNSLVAVLGASPKEDRYSFMAVKMLKEYGHKPIPVHPAGRPVDGAEAVRSLGDIAEEVDTLTMYVNSSISDKMTSLILELKPRRVIFNPGSENQKLAQKLAENSVQVVEACTLVMLRTDQF